MELVAKKHDSRWMDAVGIPDNLIVEDAITWVTKSNVGANKSMSIYLVLSEGTILVAAYCNSGSQRYDTHVLQKNLKKQVTHISVNAKSVIESNYFIFINEKAELKTIAKCEKESVEEREIGINTIDWEQRRYEIAKDVMASYYANGDYSHNNSDSTLAKWSVAAADALIKALEGYKENQ